MARRERKIQKKFRLTKEENYILKRNMTIAGVENFEQYARKMIFQGFVINKDFSHLKELTKQLSMIGTNINQVAKKVNGTNQFYKDDMAIMAKNYEDLLKEINGSLLKMIYEDRKLNNGHN
ncbi:plasmid mobilization protein [Vagococcus salmoninarum]|uniref:plasmid mobilization protein n=1 Tax=Vagococcus salmoninarum TaxID=2739 RepID=UPI0028D3A20F|nr:plasmid mobilization relaxosome protein MobC [Vagococcus salmoninarum]